MWPILIPPDDHWPQNMWKTKENTMECLRKNRAEWKSTKKHPKNYFLKTFPKNILFFGQNYPKICTKKDFKKNWLVTYTLGWNCSGGSVVTTCNTFYLFVTACKSNNGQVRRGNPDLWLWLGDNAYSDGTSMTYKREKWVKSKRLGGQCSKTCALWFCTRIGKWSFLPRYNEARDELHYVAEGPVAEGRK